MNLSNEQLEEFLKNTSRDDFAAQLNTKFRVNQDSVWFDTVLVEVSEVKNFPRQDSFTLLFLMSEDFPFQQGNYLFEHPKLGNQEIFVVPVEHASDGIVFQAVYNRLIPKDQK